MNDTPQTKKCPKCAEEVLQDASVCKHCKADLRSWFIRHPIWTFFFGMIILGMMIPNTETETKSSGTNSNGMKGSAAKICARNYIEANLTSPSTADFPWSMDWTEMEDGSFVISSYVDSQNAFGATVRTEFYCTVKVYSTGTPPDCSTSCVLN